MTYNTLSTQPRPFLAMTGLTLAEFRDLLPAFVTAYERIYPLDAAYDRLEDGHKTKLFLLLKSHPHYEEFLAAGRPADVNEVEWAVLRGKLHGDPSRPIRPPKKRGVERTTFSAALPHIFLWPPAISLTYAWSRWWVKISPPNTKAFSRIEESIRAVSSMQKGRPSAGAGSISTISTKPKLISPS